MSATFSFLVCFLPMTYVWCECPSTVHHDVRAFGIDCKYRCNCKNNVQCDNVTGRCPDGCLPGWMGPACQYRNLAAAAKGKIVKQYPFQAGAQDAIDLNLTTCSTIGQGGGRRQLEIDLIKHYYLVGFVIKIQADQLDNFPGFTIEICNSTNNSNTRNLCYKHVSGEKGEIVMDVACAEPVIGQYVLISLADNEIRELSICEVEIFGGRLVSFQKPALMDSIYVDNGTWDPFYAVDGKVMLDTNENQTWKRIRTCASTEHNETVRRDRWWRVDLETTYNILAFYFYGRKEQWFDWQMRDFALEESEDDNTYSQVFKDPLNSSNVELYQPLSEDFLQPRRARFLKVVRRQAVLLGLCEVEIYAECPFGFCGWECNKTCMCSSQTTGTHKINGTCPDGCIDRWTGVNQMCDKKCDEYHWGEFCENRCGNCTVSCSVVNGTCPGSCKPGFEQPYCREACPGGKYGQDCMSKCGSCKDAAFCDKVDGSCLAGCESGYKPPLCNETCSTGWYGPNCSNKCGYCRSEYACNFVNGTCLSGCVVGYQPSLCQTKCTLTSFGEDCLGKCGKCKSKSDCDYINGHCSDGCELGWETQFCNKKIDVGSCKTTEEFIIGIVVVCFVIVVATVVNGIMFYKRCSTKFKAEKEEHFYYKPSVSSAKQQDDSANYDELN